MKGKRSVVQHGNDSDPTLSSLPVLLMDCQTTGAAPTSGHLLEVAWSSGTAARPLEKGESHLCRLPEGVTIPPAVGRVTGIEAADLGTADPPIRVRRRLRCAISKPCCGIRPVMAVIHYARFERPFLDRWFDSGGCGRRFPLRILCTHEISRRLSPATVAENLEGILRHAAHRVRRARWFCLLSESSLCWTARNRGNKDRHGWIIRCAGLNERLPVGEHRTPPIPPGWQKGCRIRQQNFDVSAYDRMRVLTTEIRRLVAENRTVALRCGPAHLLETDALADALEWL